MIFNCIYCNKICNSLVRPCWQCCSSCNTNFFLIGDIINYIEFYSNPSDFKYIYKLVINPVSKRTKLIYYMKVMDSLAMDWEYRENIIMETYSILNVNPDNLKEKIQTLLMML